MSATHPAEGITGPLPGAAAAAVAANIEEKVQDDAPHQQESNTTPAGTLAQSGSNRDTNEKHSSRSSLTGNDDKIPTPRQATPPPEPKKRGLFSKKPKKEAKEEDASDLIKPVSLFSLYRYATKAELIMNFIGLILSAAAGAAAPLMTLIFGRLSAQFVGTYDSNLCYLTTRIFCCHLQDSGLRSDRRFAKGARRTEEAGQA
jgi:hypothetical protein